MTRGGKKSQEGGTHLNLYTEVPNYMHSHSSQHSALQQSQSTMHRAHCTDNKGRNSSATYTHGGKEMTAAIKRARDASPAVAAAGP